MPFIYCITNQINGKQYVGKTSLTIQQRFMEHISDSQRSRYNKRPLYDAFNKYGISNFIVEKLEEVKNDEEACIREQYWIKKLGTFHNGYNVTYGGDGKRLYDYEQLAKSYQKHQSVKKVAEIFHCDEKPIRLACKEYGIQIQIAPNKKQIKRTDPLTNEIKIYESITDAARDIPNKEVEKARKNISRALNTQRLGYGYKFEYIDAE